MLQPLAIFKKARKKGIPGRWPPTGCLSAVNLGRARVVGESFRKSYGLGFKVCTVSTVV
ncbi:MAG: hypothetical protein LBV77_00770 [Candidatus Adiutrix intracellularis]|nr:hypothetical protein [Candidatus Adiutrix intracellularis]